MPQLWRHRQERPEAVGKAFLLCFKEQSMDPLTMCAIASAAVLAMVSVVEAFSLWEKGQRRYVLRQITSLFRRMWSRP